MNKYLKRCTVAYLWVSAAVLVLGGVHFLDAALFTDTRSISGNVRDVEAITQGISRGWRRALYVRLAGDEAYYRVPRFLITAPTEDALRRATRAYFTVDVEAHPFEYSAAKPSLRPNVTHKPEGRFHLEYLRKPDVPALSYNVTSIMLDGTPYLTPRSYCYEMLGRSVLLWAMAWVVVRVLLLSGRHGFPPHA